MPVGRLRDDGEALTLQQHFEALAHNLMVVGNQY